jgi:hypothetical protein
LDVFEKTFFTGKEAQQILYLKEFLEISVTKKHCYITYSGEVDDTWIQVSNALKKFAGRDIFQGLMSAGHYLKSSNGFIHNKPDTSWVWIVPLKHWKTVVEKAS